MGLGLIEAVVPARLGRSYRWLLGASWATNLGDGISVAAGPLLVASLTGDPFLVAMAALLRWAPPMVFGLWAGALSDRWDRRRIVLVANTLRITILAGLVTLMLTGTLTVALALMALGLIAIAEVFADNTTTTLAPMLVHRDDLPVANARLMTGFLTLNQLAGPPIGAALFAVGTVFPFAAEAIVVVAGVLMVSRVVLPPHGRTQNAAEKTATTTATATATETTATETAATETASERRRGIWRDIAEGVRWTIRHPAVRTLVLTILIFNVTYGAAWSVLVLYAQQQLGLGAIGFGLLTTVLAVGGMLGTALYGAITRRVSLGNLMRVGLIIETLTHLALALTTSAWIAGPVFLVFGAHAFIWGTTSLTIRQRAVPIQLQGRVTSVHTICVFGGLVFGSAIGGLLATRYGVTAPFWFAFIGSAIFVVALWREMTRIAHAEDAPAQRLTTVTQSADLGL
jgi:MFS family permease